MRLLGDYVRVGCAGFLSIAETGNAKGKKPVGVQYTGFNMRAAYRTHRVGPALPFDLATCRGKSPLVRVFLAPSVRRFWMALSLAA